MAVVKKKVTRKKVVAKKKAAPKKGSRKGVPNKKTDNLRMSLLEYARKDGGLSPVEYLLTIANNADENQAIRMDAAKAAAPYCHPKLRSTEIKGEIIPATLIIRNA